MKLRLWIAFFILLSTIIKAQNISVGSIDKIEERLRNEQLLGEIDSSVSFTLRPLPQSLIYTNRDTVHIQHKNILHVIALPLTLLQQYNTFSPLGFNDGAIIPAKGYQVLLTGGFYANYGRISLQLKPEFVFADNPIFETFPNSEKSFVRKAYQRYLHEMNAPERLGTNNYNKFFWGQSSINIAVSQMSIGISTENLWWGPGQRNSLLMSNNAPGFLHFTLNTTKPIKTFLGSFEGQLISGKLNDSGFDSPSDDYIIDGISYKFPKEQDWRYISGISINYQPKWVPGLFIGMNRVFQVYHSKMGNGFTDYFPVITGFQKNKLQNEDSKQRDQIASLFSRWVLKKSKAEFYMEYGWNDYSSDIWDLIDSPEHSRAYLIGFSKIFTINSDKEKYFKFNFETTQMEQTADRIVRPAGSWYIHGYVRDGYTVESQVIGAGIGPGSNLQTLDFSVWNKDKFWGIQLERYAHNLDFYYDAYTDSGHKWVDLNLNSYAYHRFENIGVQVKLNTAWMRHYQWQANNNKLNIQIHFGLEYNF